MNKRGSIILHILVSGVAVALIASLLLRMTLLRATSTSRSHKAAQMKRSTESSLAVLQTYWSAAGLVCSNTVPGYSCVGATPGFCGCTCTPTLATDPTVTVLNKDGLSGPGPCKMTIVTPDLP